MGLDMYLNAERYVSQYDSRDAQLLAQLSTLPLPSRMSGKIKTITAEVAYWRKANAIHNWIVTNCNEGVDDCSRVSLSYDQLQELVRICMEVIAFPERAPDLLPTANGFFFGSTDYGESYIGDLDSTITQIEPLLSEEYREWDFYYQASW